MVTVQPCSSARVVIVLPSLLLDELDQPRRPFALPLDEAETEELLARRPLAAELAKAVPARAAIAGPWPIVVVPSAR